MIILYYSNNNNNKPNRYYKNVIYVISFMCVISVIYIINNRLNLKPILCQYINSNVSMGRCCLVFYSNIIISSFLFSDV